MQVGWVKIGHTDEKRAVTQYVLYQIAMFLMTLGNVGGLCINHQHFCIFRRLSYFCTG